MTEIIFSDHAAQRLRNLHSHDPAAARKLLDRLTTMAKEEKSSLLGRFRKVATQDRQALYHLDLEEERVVVLDTAPGTSGELRILTLYERQKEPTPESDLKELIEAVTS